SRSPRRVRVLLVSSAGLVPPVIKCLRQGYSFPPARSLPARVYCSVRLLFPACYVPARADRGCTVPPDWIHVPGSWVRTFRTRPIFQDIRAGTSRWSSLVWKYARESLFRRVGDEQPVQEAVSKVR